MRRFKSAHQAQRFLSLHGVVLTQATANPLGQSHIVTSSNGQKNSQDVQATGSMAIIMKENKWVRLLAYISGFVNQELLLQNEYLGGGESFACASAVSIAIV